MAAVWGAVPMAEVCVPKVRYHESQSSVHSARIPHFHSHYPTLLAIAIVRG